MENRFEFAKEKVLGFLKSETVDGEAISQEQINAIALAWANSNCLICHKEKPLYFGIWVPSRDTCLKMNLPVEKQRSVFYSLCEEHSPKNNDIEYVEKVIIGNLNAPDSAVH